MSDITPNRDNGTNISHADFGAPNEFTSLRTIFKQGLNKDVIVEGTKLTLRKGNCPHIYISNFRFCLVAL